ncbi:helix-turn-helix domain-containing protein [Lysinibacillus sphaericus]|uniref:helix-turn-helix domain-containing protein n=1 Tax=Lysinibacillus sphaericus TaxID=1421 RepID=UPI003D005295
MVRSKHPVELKLKIFHLLKRGHFSIRELCKQYEISSTTLQRWRNRLEMEGEEALKAYLLNSMDDQQSYFSRT